MPVRMVVVFVSNQRGKVRTT